MSNIISAQKIMNELEDKLKQSAPEVKCNLQLGINPVDGKYMFCLFYSMPPQMKNKKLLLAPQYKGYKLAIEKEGQVT